MRVLKKYLFGFHSSTLVKFKLVEIYTKVKKLFMQFKSLFLTEVIFLNELFNKIALFSKPQF